MDTYYLIIKDYEKIFRKYMFNLIFKNYIFDKILGKDRFAVYSKLKCTDIFVGRKSMENIDDIKSLDIKKYSRIQYSRLIFINFQYIATIRNDDIAYTLRLLNSFYGKNGNIDLYFYNIDENNIKSLDIIKKIRHDFKIIYLNEKEMII